MIEEEEISRRIANGELDRKLISDGHHTFDELYAHRVELFVALGRSLVDSGESNPDAAEKKVVWRSRRHSDGSKDEGWFVMGIETIPGKQITYHLPDHKWPETDFALTLDKAPEYDGHTPDDVLQRLSRL